MKRYVLVYSERGGPYASPKNAGDFAGIDVGSGGYPFPTDNLNCVRWFPTKEEAERYQGKGLWQDGGFPFLDVHEVEVHTKKVS